MTVPPPVRFELVAELHPSRHTWFATVIRNLIGHLEAPQERTP